MEQIYSTIFKNRKATTLAWMWGRSPGQSWPVEKVSSFFKSRLERPPTSKRDEAVKGKLIELVATSERERRTFSRKPLPDLACAHVDACWGVLRNSNLGGDAISVLGNFSDAQKCDFVKKSGVQILETLNSPANPALLAAVIDLLIALPDGLLGRIKSLFTGRRAPSEVEEALRCHVESELVDGFSRFPEWAFTLFIFDNANMFVTLFNSDMRVAKL